MADDRADDRKKLMWFHKWAKLLDAHNRLQATHAEYKEAFARVSEASRLQSADAEFAHRLATMLECALLNRIGAWDEGHALLDEYRAACCAAMPEPQTFMGEPVLTHNTCLGPASSG